MILILVWAIIVSVGIVILIVFLIRTRMKYENKFEAIKFTIEKERAEQQEKFKITVIEERDDAKELSRHSIKGKIGEQMSPLFPEFYSKYEPSDARFLGSPIDYIIFKNMSEYDRKTKAEDVPIDVILVEVKSTKKAGLTEKEKAIRIAVEDGRVSFDIIRQNIDPQKESEPKENKRNELEKKKMKLESLEKRLEELTEEEKKPRKSKFKKFMQERYRKWTESDDEFLKNYWNDKSNTQSEHEKIQELSKKFDRSNGAIVSRLEKHELY